MSSSDFLVILSVIVWLLLLVWLMIVIQLPKHHKYGWYNVFSLLRDLLKISIEGLGWAFYGLLEGLEWTFNGLGLGWRRIFGGKCIQCNDKTTHIIRSTYLIEAMRKNEIAEKKSNQGYSSHWSSLQDFMRASYDNLADQGSSKAAGPWYKSDAAFVCDSSCKIEFVAEWKKYAILVDQRDEDARLKREAREEDARLAREVYLAEIKREKDAALAKKEYELKCAKDAALAKIKREEKAALAKIKREEKAALAKIKREEKAALAKKQAAVREKEKKQRQAEAERLRKAAEEHRRSILDELNNIPKIHPDFISDLTETIPSSVMRRYEFRDVLRSLWAPLGRPKKDGEYFYWQGWVLANADYSVGIEETKSSILKLINTTINEMQKDIPDLMLLASSIDDFHRLVGLWEKHEHLGHDVISRIFQGENETFVLVDVDGLQS